MKLALAPQMGQGIMPNDEGISFLKLSGNRVVAILLQSSSPLSVCAASSGGFRDIQPHPALPGRVCDTSCLGCVPDMM